MKLTLGICALVLAGCSSTTVTSGQADASPPVTSGADASPEPAAAKCAARSGVYQYADSLVSGTCGPASAASSFSITASTQAFAAAYVIAERAGAGKMVDVSTFIKACSGSVKVAADNCQIDYSITCPQVGIEGTYQKVGVITWSANGDSATETQDYSQFTADGAPTCTGRYSPSVSR